MSSPTPHEDDDKDTLTEHIELPPVEPDEASITVKTFLKAGTPKQQLFKLKLVATVIIALCIIAILLHFVVYDVALIEMDMHHGMITTLRYGGVFIGVLEMGMALFTFFYARKNTCQSFVLVQSVIVSLVWMLFAVMGVSHLHSCCRKDINPLFLMASCHVIVVAFVLIAVVALWLIVNNMPRLPKSSAHCQYQRQDTINVATSNGYHPPRNDLGNSGDGHDREQDDTPPQR